MDPDSVTTAQAATLLGVSPQTVQKWVDAGHLPAWRTVGGHRRVDAAAVQRMVRERAPPAQRGHDIVLAEDNAVERELIAQCIRSALPDARLRACADGVAALIEIGRAMPDILISDVRMPDMDGLAVLASLRSHPQTHRIQVILVTHHSDDELRATFGPLPTGVPVLRKPVQGPALLAAITRLMAARPAA